MKRLCFSAAVILGIAIAANGQQGARATATAGPAAERPRAAAQEHAIKAADDAFVQEYNQGDSKALAARFTEDAEVVEADGTRYKGRSPIEERLKETFAASPGVRLEIQNESIQFLSPEVVKEEGRTLVKPAKGAAEERRHTALLVKRDGRWLICSIREEPGPMVAPHARLKELEWMIGDWVDQGHDSHVRVSCRWSEDGNFLVRRFTVAAQGKSVMTVHQRMGWDPLARQFRSWEFDSEGGYGEGKWVRDGERWVIKHTGVRPEGTIASATHIVARENPDLVRWSSIDRVVGDETVAQEDHYVMVRVPPAPRVPSAGRGAAAPSASDRRKP
jgi:uncharacterized protein (TIGR02246 family)